MWKLKDPSIKTVGELVQKNTGMSDDKLLDDTQEYKIYDTDKVVNVLKDAAKNNTKVTIVGDYDADGVSATSIMILLFRAMKINHEFILPKRFKDGYGLNVNIVDRINDGIIITVDNGIVAFDAIKKAKDKGLYVIITDHHSRHPSGELPIADIIIDPSTLKGTSDFDYYCGAGIAYKIAEAALGKEHPLMKKISAIASIGTVADMVPLVDDNRKIVSKGLVNFLKPGGRTMGMYKLTDKMYIKNKMTATDISFGIGPAINAAGRLEGTEVFYTTFNKKGEEVEESCIADASMGVHILTDVYEDFAEAEKAVDDLININNTRKELKKIQFNKIMETIEDECLYGDAPIVVYNPGLHLGIVGILAGEITEHFNVPAIVLTDNPKDPNSIKGSARSVPGIDLKALLDKHAEDMIAYGGHPGAAGLSLKKDKLYMFREHLNEELEDYEFERAEITYDFEIEEKDVGDYLLELDKYGPFGQNNPEPIFYIKNFQLFPKNGSLYEYKGTEHVILQGAFTNANAFFLQDKFKEIKNPQRLDILCTLGRSFDKEGNEKPTLFIKDLVESKTKKKIKKTDFFKELEKINMQGEIKI